ncbi:hypothetical protein HDF12_001608 [Edaphobacter lichenicola]|uniref:Uncharacterized protein n=1 Tax=Tunturiibacter lichenicola TaxID=2051959 RepID=A0A7Y9NKZ8_9BACT|nr:hypothetical protein [Edaphobacter lichenicola]
MYIGLPNIPLIPSPLRMFCLDQGHNRVPIKSRPRDENISDSKVAAKTIRTFSDIETSRAFTQSSDHTTRHAPLNPPPVIYFPQFPTP